MKKNDKKEINYLKKNAIKEFDYFLITDSIDSTNIFNLSLKEIDFKDYVFQKENKTLVPEKYNLYLPGIFFKALEIDMFLKRKIVYGSLISARAFIFNELEIALNKKIDKKIPFIFETKYGESFFNKNNYIKMPNKKCFGLENKRVKLDKKIRNLLYFNKKLEKDIDKITKKYENITFKKHKYETTYFIIGGVKAAENINLKSFFNDFYKLEESFIWLKKDIKKLIKKYKKQI